MMAQNKLEPTASPSVERPQTGKGNDTESLNLSLRISGGVHSERYEFYLDIDPSRKMTSSLNCRLSDRRAEIKGERLHDEEYNELIKRIKTLELMDTPGDHGKYIPCTLVGSLEIILNGRVFKTTFIADPEQEKSQRPNPKQVNKFVEELYQLASKKFKMKSVKP